jgi:predicted nucleic acid-binding Zn ribbon protein
MPTYIYRREDGSTFEIEQRITEPALTHDPDTGQRVERVIAGAGLLFKGSGFYLTDYARASAGKKEASPESTGESKPAEKSAATTPAPASPPSSDSKTTSTGS